MKKIIIVGLFAVIVLTGCGLTTNKEASKEVNKNKQALSMDEAKIKALEFINNNLVQPGTTAEFKSITEEDNLYKLIVTVGDSEDIESYISKDGKNFIPSMMDIEEVNADRQAREQSAAAAANEQKEVVKNEKPVVELFVMSHCPYGTQAEKAIIPAIETLGDKIDGKIRFVHYFMHGETEETETKRQLCIREEQPDKFLTYLLCFLEDADADRCLTKHGVFVNDCLATGKADGYLEEDSVLSKVYDAQIKQETGGERGIGSPLLVINGVKTSFNRSPAGALSVICSAFNTAPEECSTELSSTTPSSGFGSSGSTSSGSCN
jgi:hypothetical protein